MRIENTNNFTELHREVKQSQRDQGYKSGKHLRLDDQNKQKGLYFHTGVSRAGIFDWSGKHAARRAEKQANAGQQVWQSIANQYGEGVANRIFKNVLRYEGGDHRASVTIGDLDRIGQALPQQARLQRVKREAMDLAASGAPEMKDVMRHFEKNLDVYSSDEFADMPEAKARSDQFRAMQAMACYDRISRHGYTDRDFKGFLKAVDARDPGSGDPLEFPMEVRKQWMANMVLERFFEQEGRFPLNLRGNNRQNVINSYRNNQGTADEKMALLRDTFNELPRSDANAIVEGLAIGITQMQGGQRGEVLDAIRNESERRVELERSQRNRQVVRNFLKNPYRFRKVVENAGWYPDLLQPTEKQYISNRLRGLAELQAQAGNEINPTWVETQVGEMLRELDEPSGGTPPDTVSTARNLPEMQRQAEAAAEAVLKGILNPRSTTPEQLTRVMFDFAVKAELLTSARVGVGTITSDDRNADIALLFNRAAQRVRITPHDPDPMATLRSMQYAIEMVYLENDKKKKEVDTIEKPVTRTLTHGVSRGLEQAAVIFARRRGRPDPSDEIRQVRVRVEDFRNDARGRGMNALNNKVLQEAGMPRPQLLALARSIRDNLSEFHSQVTISGTGVFGSEVNAELHRQFVEEIGVKPLTESNEFPNDHVHDTFILDLLRIRYEIGGTRIDPGRQSRPETVSLGVEALRDVCTSNNELDTKLLEAVSKLACQTGLGPLSTALGNGHGGSITGDVKGRQDWQCSIRREENGDVTIDFRRSDTNVHVAPRMNQQDKSWQYFDPDKSQFSASFSCTIHKEAIDNDDFKRAVTVSDVEYDVHLAPDTKSAALDKSEKYMN